MRLAAGRVSWGSVVGGVGLLYRSGVQLAYVLLYRSSSLVLYSRRSTGPLGFAAACARGLSLLAYR